MVVFAYGIVDSESDTRNRVGMRRWTDLLVEDGLGLTTITGLLAVVTTLSLRVEGSLASLVLCHLVGTIEINRRSL